jgi:hypothetical protein
MIVLAWFLFLIPCVIVAYWVGRAARLNRTIEREPERVLYNPGTGEVLEPDSPEWRQAMRQGNVVSFIP